MLQGMAKIFYLGGSHARGMIRAVVTLEELNSLVPLDAVTYLGTVFPELESQDPIIVVQVSIKETAAESALPWAIGFSRIHTTPAEFNERLRFLPQPEKPTREIEKQDQRRNGSGLLRWLTRGAST